MRSFKATLENTQVDFKLRGYALGSDPSYFSDPSDITPITSNQWTIVDVSANVDNDADGVILFLFAFCGESGRGSVLRSGIVADCFEEACHGQWLSVSFGQHPTFGAPITGKNKQPLGGDPCR